MRRLAAIPLSLALALGACSSDALYTICTETAQCGARTYEMGERDVQVFLVCREVVVEVEPGRTTSGRHCTLPCVNDAECLSEAGLGQGRCLALDDGGAGHCYQSCEREACYPSSTCETVRADGVEARVCLPSRAAP
ncbi:MAG: hypothetical protein KF729_19435 [Sandaracinaceae bacterium]|nr:hypothetical protein [Sandaracinaceae bacterium]